MRSLIHSLCGGVDTPLLGGGWLNCIFECGGMCVEIKGVVLRYIGDKSHLLIFLIKKLCITLFYWGNFAEKLNDKR